MTIEEAKKSLGKEFKVIGFTGGILGRFDIIRSMDDEGWIHGDNLSAPVEDCRLKEQQPEHLKKHPQQSQFNFS